MATLVFPIFIRLLVGAIIIYAILFGLQTIKSRKDKALKRFQFEYLGIDEDVDAFERSTICLKKLTEVKDDFTKKVNEIGILNGKLGVLRKENADLNDQAKSLKQTLKSKNKLRTYSWFEL